jgi:hypothetical protein
MTTRYLTRAEVADRLGVSEDHVDMLTSRDELHCCCRGWNDSCGLWRDTEIDRFIAESGTT